MMNYKTLLNKLFNTGIRGITHKWFKSYLENRMQMVEIKSIDTNKREIKHIRSHPIHISGSIPQGSVLGCMLFLIYINELPNFIDNQCNLFADDISVIMSC